MEDCIFCKIVDKQLSSNIVFENSKVLGFLDIEPSHEMHVLFVPKKHVSSLSELDPSNLEIINYLYSAALEFAKKEGLNHHRTLINTGEPFQEVFHVHLHLLSGNRLKSRHN
ncbi:MAG: HIT domain-containing protein [Bdellovibrionota bacterium]|nr:HIT domain-containing protein [Bdellovibrionota bacterium]